MEEITLMLFMIFSFLFILCGLLNIKTMILRTNSSSNQFYELDRTNIIKEGIIKVMLLNEIYRIKNKSALICKPSLLEYWP
jgi:hypothetical protein